MKLLIVDDEYHVIKTVKYLLQMSPIQLDEIFEAQSAKDAITIIEKEHPEILITDVLMADVTGLDLMNYLNNTSIPIKTIVISGYNNFEYIRAALKEGGVDYLLKPIDADQLFAAVETAIDQWQKEDARKKQTLQHLDMIHSMSSLCKETLLYLSKIFNKLGFIFSVSDPLLFFPAHGKILAWAGRKIYPGSEGNLKENLGE